MKTTIFKIIAIALGIVISLCFGELIARVTLFGSDAFSYQKVNSFKSLAVSGLIKKSDNPNLPYELKPNNDQYFKTKRIVINKDQYRGKHYQKKKKKGVYRIAVIGDSFTMGSGVGEDETYVRRTEERLNSKINDAIEVINFGVAGYNLPEYDEVLKNVITQYQPDQIVIGFCGDNDHYKNGVDYQLNERIVKEEQDVYFHSFLKKILKRSLTKKQSQVYKEYQKNHINEYFKKFSLRSQKYDTPVLIFNLSLWSSKTKTTVVETIAEKHKLAFLDGSNTIKNNAISDYVLNKLDAHPNEKANALFAKKLSEYLLNSVKNFDRNH